MGSGSALPVYDSAVRRDAAAYARRYFDRTITRDTYLAYFGDSDDPLIQALVDAVIHEPPRYGLLGLRDRLWISRYWKPVERLIQELEKGSAGESPAERVYPRTSLKGLMIGGAFLLWAALYGARHLAELLTDMERGGALPFWEAFGRVLVVCTLGLITAAGLEEWIYKFQLYRTRKLSAGERDADQRSVAA